MIVLVPVSRFRVGYETAQGRPYSPLERMVLDAIAGDVSTLKSLKATFRIHERLLVEAIVTLVGAGWVAVVEGANATFVLTRSGDAARQGGREPVSVVVRSGQPQMLVMERLTGQLARAADARSWRREDLKGLMPLALEMRERIMRNSLDEAQVQKLLQKSSGQWVRRIGPIRQASRRSHFLVLDVDPETRTVRGLPPTWRPALEQRVRDAAMSRVLDGVASDSASRVQHPAMRFVDARESQPALARPVLNHDQVAVVRGGKALDDLLANAISRAQTSLILALPNVESNEQFAHILERSVPALRRGVRVDLLVGYVGVDFNLAEGIASANRLSYDLLGNEGRTKLRLGPQPTRSAASFLLYDQGDSLNGAVANWNWAARSSRTHPVGLILSEPSLVADLSRAASSLWRSAQPGPDGAGSAERWRELAARAEDEAARREARGGEAVSSDFDASAAELVLDEAHLSPEADAFEVGVFGDFSGMMEGTAFRGVSVRIFGSIATELKVGGQPD